jgi:hypothetical protein
MPNSKHLTHGISNLVSLITKIKLGFSDDHNNDVADDDAHDDVQQTPPIL